MDAGHIKILIAEDESIIALDIKKILEKSGYESITVVNNGNDALKIIATEKSDLVLMDIQLGENKNGIETADIIQKEYSVPVIYLTALADDETFNKARKTEPAGFILKPFDETTLLSTIEGVISKQAEPAIKKKLPVNKPAAQQGFRIKGYPGNISGNKIEGGISSRLYENVTILFSDFEAVNEDMDDIPPDVFLNEINDLFMHLDLITRKYGLVKVKSTAEIYMISSSALHKENDHGNRVVKAAIEMFNYLDERNRFSEYKWTMRASIKTKNIPKCPVIISDGLYSTAGKLQIPGLSY